MQLAAQRRFSKGLQMTASWTWAHATDQVSDVFDGIGFFIKPQSENDLKAEHASAGFDVRHRFVASFVWDPPWIGGKSFYGGWRLAGIFVAQAGQPFTVNSSLDVNNDGTLTDRLNSVAGIEKVGKGAIQYRLPPDFNSDAGALSFLAHAGENGAVGRNTFRAQGVATLDLSLLKSFRLGNNRGVEFRVECFNLFDRTHFGVPARIFEGPAFGRAVDTSVRPRQAQLALKFTF
jgi:hypothetical protein